MNKTIQSSLTNPVGVIPLGDRVIIRRLAERKATKGGILIAESAQEKPQFGVVVSAGNEVKNHYLARGRVIVTFGKYSGDEIEIDGEALLMMREDQITALIADRQLIDHLLVEGV